MKKIFFIFFTLLIFTNFSYASFPINVNPLIDTLQTDQIRQYHSSLLKMGIDLNTCQCESCRRGIAPLTVEGNEVLKKYKSNIWINLLIILSILSILLIILLFRWVENFNKSGGIGVG